MTAPKDMSKEIKKKIIEFVDVTRKEKAINMTVTRGLIAEYYRQAIKKAVTSNNAELADMHTEYALQYGLLLGVPGVDTLKTINGGETK